MAEEEASDEVSDREKSLEMRVAELEDKLSQVHVTDEEMAAYRKVAGLLGQQGATSPAAGCVVDCVGGCINECRVCTINQCIRYCIISNPIINQCIRECIISNPIIRQCVECQPCWPGTTGGGSTGFDKLGM